MPSITKAEHNRLKIMEEKYSQLCRDVEVLHTNNRRLTHELDLFQARLKSSEGYRDNIFTSLQDQMREAEKWKRYYDAVRETFKVEEEVEIPGCFSTTDSVQYIVERQRQIEEQRKINEKLDNLSR